MTEKERKEALRRLDSLAVALAELRAIAEAHGVVEPIVVKGGKDA